MKKTNVLITSGAVLLLGLALPEQCIAQRANLVRGVVHVWRGSTNPADSLSCGPASSHRSYFYGNFNREEVTLRFSFGNDGSRAFGSWSIRRSPASGRGTLSGSPVIMAGTFTGGNVNLRGNQPLPPVPAGHFFLLGRTSRADGHCFDQAQPKDIMISGSCERPIDGINFQALDLRTGQIYVRGRFSRVVDVVCTTGPASSVDRTLHLRD